MANCRISSEHLLKMLNDDGVINTALMTDVAHFHLSGYVNKQNYRYWAPENPQELHQRPLHSDRSTVWCGIASFGVPWPLLLWRQQRCSHYCDIRALCGNASQLLWTRVTSSWDRSLISMVSARSNSPHSRGINKCSAGNVSTTRHFHGCHVRLISPPVITFYGGISKAEFSSLSLEP